MLYSEAHRIKRAHRLIFRKAIDVLRDVKLGGEWETQGGGVVSSLGQRLNLFWEGVNVPR